MRYSYAQNAEDIILFRCFKNKHDGLYVDVGASAPVKDNVTYAFYDIGWRGINVEPIPERARELRWARPRDTTIEAAAAASEGEATFYRTAGMGGLSALDNYYLGDAKKFTVWPIVVKTRPLSVMLAENDVTDIDFLKIDVEGAESAVLAGLDLQRWRPVVIVVEAVTPTKPPRPNRQEWEPKLLAAGYIFVYFDGLNRFYLRRESEALKTRFHTPANVFDDFRLYSSLGDPLRNSAHTHHAFATALARKLLESLAAGEIGDVTRIFTCDLSPRLLASEATPETAGFLIRLVFAREPRKDEAVNWLAERSIAAAQLLEELLNGAEFKMACARIAA